MPRTCWVTSNGRFQAFTTIAHAHGGGLVDRPHDRRTQAVRPSKGGGVTDRRSARAAQRSRLCSRRRAPGRLPHGGRSVRGAGEGARHPAGPLGAEPFVSERSASRTGRCDVAARGRIEPLLAACGAPPLPSVRTAGRVVGKVSQLFNRPEAVVRETLDGVAADEPRHGAARRSGRGDPQRPRPARGARKVAVLSGGSGRKPAHAGSVGVEMLTAAIVGDVLALPSTDAALVAIRRVAGPPVPS